MSIEESILPFTVKQLIEIIMNKKNLSFSDSYFYLVNSNLYKMLASEDSKYWYLSGIALYDELEKEKHIVKTQTKVNSKELLFFVFCIENFKINSGKSEYEILSIFHKYNVLKFLQDNFELLHTQDKEYIISSIDKFLKSYKNKIK